MIRGFSGPSDIYKYIDNELVNVINDLEMLSSDPDFTQAQNNAKQKLGEIRKDLSEQLLKLEKYSEWKTFTVAFYGETGAGKSTIIEILRIILNEPKKVVQRQEFLAFQKQHNLNDEQFNELDGLLHEAESRLKECTCAIANSFKECDQRRKDVLAKVDKLKVHINKYKNNASIWLKLLNLFRKTNEEAELQKTYNVLNELEENCQKKDNELKFELGKATQYEKDVKVKLAEFKEKIMVLDELADGGIIGDGRADFTKKLHNMRLTVKGWISFC